MHQESPSDALESVAGCAPLLSPYNVLIVNEKDVADHADMHYLKRNDILGLWVQDVDKTPAPS